MTEGRAWIDRLPPAMHAQARLLRALVTAVEADERVVALELGGSLAAGRGDELSDLDLGLWHGPERPSHDEVDRIVRSLGEVVDVNAAPWDGAPRWWACYADGVQLDLVVLPAESRPGRAPGGVVLLDRSGGRLDREFTPSVLRADADQSRQWLLDGWEALANVAKYLRRGALLEAADQVHRARERVFQLWAVGEGIDYPVFGVTSLLDAPEPVVPPGIESTYSTLDAGSLTAAARALAELLQAAGRHYDPSLDTPLAEFVTARLQELDRPARRGAAPRR